MDASRLEFMAFWAINDALDRDRLMGQLEELKACGMDGVVFHPRYYTNEPPYMSEVYLQIVSDVILHAKALGMIFWLYDENGWPSGTAGGMVLEQNPGLVTEWLEWAEMRTGAGAESGRMEAIIRSESGVSPLDSDATASFLEITHEGYRKGLVPEAFEYVTGFFADEVSFQHNEEVTFMRGTIPWERRLPGLYRERFGEELEPLLSLLFDGSGEGAAFRTKYWELLTDILINGFYRPVANWCKLHGKLFTAHLKGEENPFFQLSASGSCFHVLKEVSIPAIDALERYPGNSFYPRLVHSVAMQQGRPGCLAEAHGGAGWGTNPEAFEAYVLWLAGHGVERFVFHLSQYRLTSHAIHDWPPSMPLHMTWREAFPPVLERIRRKAWELRDIRNEEPELLIVTPTRGVMSAFDPAAAILLNEHDGSCVPDSAGGRISNAFIELVEICHAQGIHYELTEERTLEEIGRIEDGALLIGRRRYTRVLLPEECVWTIFAQGQTFPERIREAGIELVKAAELEWGDCNDAFSRSEDERMSAETAGRHEVSMNIDQEEIVRSGGAWTFVPVQTPWKASPPESNRFALTFRQQPNEAWTMEASLALKPFTDDSSLELLLQDEPASVSVNGQLLEERLLDVDGCRYKIPGAAAGAGVMRINLTPKPHAEPNPVGFLTGRFIVKSLTPFETKDVPQWRTKGPYELRAASAEHGDALNAADLIQSGYPYCPSPVTLSKKIRLEEPIIPDGYLQLNGVSGDVAQVSFGGRELGWSYGPDWRAKLPPGLEAGEYELRIRLFPSTFNVYGPHRHVDGDRRLTSPDQYAGIRNFADDPGAPEFTLGEYDHFVKWGIEGEVAIRCS